MTVLESISDVCPMSGTSKAVATKREKLWKVFHEKRMTEMPEVWKHSLKMVNHELDTLVCQTVNQKFIEEIIKTKFSAIFPG